MTEKPESTGEVSGWPHDPSLLRRASGVTSVPRALRGFARKKPLGAATAAVLVLMVLVALFAEVAATHDPVAQDIASRLRSPGRDFYFGTDGFGRDVFSRVVHGTRVSLSVAGISVIAGVAIGTLLGIASAYRGGKVDLAIQRLMDIILGFPFLVLAVMIVAALGTSVHSVIIAITLALIPQNVRLSWAIALSVKGETYVQAAQVAGASPVRIVLRHVLPNSAPPLVAHATSYFGVALLGEAALSFLGLGVPPPDPSWGRMIQEGARQHLEVAPWITLFPGLALSILVLSTAFWGDALRDILDPRLRSAPLLRQSQFATG